ncbi:MAG: hypothetical protein LBM27_01985 [Lactobacillaceae bacterium]|jgi:hypothetical protein|nr:hypothetical protein [Lactobacillaceae bacterium]
MRFVTVDKAPIGEYEQVSLEWLKENAKNRAKKKDPEFTDYYDFVLFNSLAATPDLQREVFESAKVRSILVPHNDQSNELYGFIKTPEDEFLFQPETLEKYLFFGQDGNTMPIGEQLRINRKSNGPDKPFKVSHLGRWHTRFTGKFGDTLDDGTIAYVAPMFDINGSSPRGLTYSIPFPNNAGEHDFFIYEQHSQNVQWRLKFNYYDNQNNLVTTMYITENHQTLIVPQPAAKLFIEVQVAGEGQFDFRWIAQRKSRHGFGTFIAGDKVLHTPGGEEILTYFQPGRNMKYMMVSFTGFLSRLPKFEMMSMLGAYDVPTLYFQDSRTDGGTFHMSAADDPEYEKMLEGEIRRYMGLLGIESDHVLVNGYSMGTLGATFYGRRLQAGQLIISKPLVDLDWYLGGGISPIEEANKMVAGWQIHARELIAGNMQRGPWGYKEKIYGQGTFANSKVALMHMNSDDPAGSGFEELARIIEEESGIPPYVESYDGPHASHMNEMYNIINSTISAFLKD